MHVHIRGWHSLRLGVLRQMVEGGGVVDRSLLMEGEAMDIPRQG